jgi:integrase
MMPDAVNGRSITSQANSGTAGLLERLEQVARRRFQNPKPFRRGSWWIIQVRRDVFINGKLTRKNRWEKLAPATMPERQVLKIASEHLRDLNQGLENIGSATNFAHYTENTYIPVALRTMAKSTQDRYKGVINNYLQPAFGKLALRDLTPMTIDRYFAGLGDSELSHESLDKIRDVLASILKRAIRHGLLVKNPMEGVELPRAKHGRVTQKPVISYEQCEQLLARIPEPYATMIYVAIWTGLRVSELIGLRWEDVHTDSLTIDERCCRGDWGAPKSSASNATIGVDAEVIKRIQRLKSLTVKVKAGRATRRYKVVKVDGPKDLVFQSVRNGHPMRDNNILSRFIKPAARAIGLEFVNWKCLRTSRATWLVQAGANPKDVQGLMRHSRISTTMDIYAQMVADSQRQAIAKVTAMVAAKRAEKEPLAVAASMMIN